MTVFGGSRGDLFYAFVGVLEGQESLRDWLKCIAQEPKGSNPNPEESSSKLPEPVLSLFRNVLVLLKDTGRSRDGDLQLLVLTEELEPSILTLSAQDQPWTKILTDWSTTATLACVSHRCFETAGNRCQKGRQMQPRNFHLSTKLNKFNRYFDKGESSAGVRKLERDTASIRITWMIARVDDLHGHPPEK